MSNLKEIKPGDLKEETLNEFLKYFFKELLTAPFLLANLIFLKQILQ